MTFTYRTTPCHCDNGKVQHDTDYGPVAKRCEECDGSAVIDACCCSCGKVVPLDPEGECERCADAYTLPFDEFQVKYCLTVVEDLGRGRIAA